MRQQNDTLVILDQASGYLQIDMLEAYAEKYKHLVIIAGSIVERGTPLPENVVWHKIVKYDQSSTFKRLYTWLFGSLSMFWIVLRQYRKAHIIAITNPPFSIFVPWLLKCSYDILIYDMYPDALVQYGYLKEKSVIFKLWSALNKKVFSKAKHIFTLTEGIKQLAQNYTEKNEIHIVPLWSSASDFEPIPRNENRILGKVNSRDKFNIVYSGNLGLTHPVEKLIDLAEILDPERFSIIIIGGGAKKKLLEKTMSEKKLKNVYLLPWQPIELLSHNLCSGDINVVTLDKQASNLSIPSKTFNILSIGNPILGICDKSSGLAELINTFDCGVISDGENLNQLAEQIIDLESDKQKITTMKANSLKASHNFTKANANAFV
jgi:glycosyltransferase involved in cell wall biosynthesis